VISRGRAGGSGHVAVVTNPELGPFAEPPEAVVIAGGAPFSHATIARRALGVPMVLVSAAQAEALHEGVSVTVDGATGTICSRPGEGTRAALPPQSAAGQSARTADGTAIDFHASVHTAQGADAALRNGAKSVGLVRTEFFVPPAGRRPGRRYFEDAFSALCDAAAPLPVTFRLIDIAADKIPVWVEGAAGLGDALGLQGVRLYDQAWLRPVVESQLAALAELSGRYDVRILLPFMASYEELRHWAGFARERLPDRVPLGAMVETPLAALDLGNWLDLVSFVAIGCNDLMQCLFAADRDRPELSGLLEPYAPPLFRFMRRVAGNAGGRVADVRLCGLLPQLAGILPVLLGMGYRAFSVDPPVIPYLARSLRGLDRGAAVRLADRACDCAAAAEVKRLLGVPA
jgi:phosphoenolpyruvate-protein kinase (PTS system EI component)